MLYGNILQNLFFFYEEVVTTYLNLGGSIGSFCISTIRITLCFAPELKATPCCDGVYLDKTKRFNSLQAASGVFPSHLRFYSIYCSSGILILSTPVKDSSTVNARSW